MGQVITTLTDIFEMGYQIRLMIPNHPLMNHYVHLKSVLRGYDVKNHGRRIVIITYLLMYVKYYPLQTPSVIKAIYWKITNQGI